MSKEEMQNLDERILEVANRSGEVRRSEDAQSAEQEERNRLIRMEKEAREEKKRIIAEQKRKAMAMMLLRVISCLLAVVAFASLLLVPEAVTVIACAGVMTFVVVAAITIDRHVRRCR